MCVYICVFGNAFLLYSLCVFLNFFHLQCLREIPQSPGSCVKEKTVSYINLLLHGSCDLLFNIKINRYYYVYTCIIIYMYTVCHKHHCILIWKELVKMGTDFKRVKFRMNIGKILIAKS